MERNAVVPTTSKLVQASIPLASTLTADSSHVTSRLERMLPGESKTQKGPLPQVLKILFLSSLPCLIVFIRTCFHLEDNVKTIDEAKQMQKHVLLSLDIVNVVHATQLERGSSIIYISSDGNPNATARLQHSYTETDSSFSKLAGWVTMETDGVRFQSPVNYHGMIREFRRRLSDHDVTISIHQTLEFYSKIISSLIRTLSENLRRNAASTAWSEYVAYHMLTLGKEEAGIERALGCTYFTQDDFRILEYHEKLVLGTKYMENSQQYSTYVTSLLHDKYTDTGLRSGIEKLRADILHDQGQGKESSVSACESWFDTMSQYLELLKDVQHDVGNDIIQKTEAEIASKESRLPFHISIIILSMCIVATVAMEMFLLNRKAFKYACHLFEKSVAIEEQRIKSQQLLLKTLPEVVATELLLGNEVVPERHMSVSVMFAEIVDFSELVSHVESGELVEFINAVVVAFDTRLEKYEVHKMEMMGGTTMLASGFQDRGSVDVYEIADAALDLMMTLSQIQIPASGDASEPGMKLRMGINTGQVVTGLVGNKLPRYSVFGDTVNMASRMTSTALAGMIQLTNATRLCLTRNKKYKVELRGVVSIKGKGDTTTYILVPVVPAESLPTSSEDDRQLVNTKANSRKIANLSSGQESSSQQPLFEDAGTTFRHLSDTINCRLPYL